MIGALLVAGQELATLVKARIPLDEALAALIEQTDDSKLKTIMSQIRESVNEGKSLAASCKRRFAARESASGAPTFPLSHLVTQMEDWT